MRIDSPAPDRISQLRQLWKTAFGDTDDFLDCFFSTAFSPNRCRCVTLGDRVAAALYWFDVTWNGRKLAYLYAVATHPGHRGKGLCRALMEDTHARLKLQGYDGAILVPQEEGLFRMYVRLGYRNCSGIGQITCTAGTPVSLRAIGPDEFARLRREFLPRDGVIQEGENLKFLAAQAEFFAGDDFLLTARREETVLIGLELLGNPQAAPGIVAALGMETGRFRIPGDAPWAMYLPFTGHNTAPGYFGFAFD